MVDVNASQSRLLVAVVPRGFSLKRRASEQIPLGRFYRTPFVARVSPCDDTAWYSMIQHDNMVYIRSIRVDGRAPCACVPPKQHHTPTDPPTGAV